MQHTTVTIFLILDFFVFRAEAQQKTLRSRLAAAANEATSVLMCSHKQITLVYDEFNIIQDKLGDYQQYNFQAASSLNFFPKALAKHLENYADQRITPKPKESKTRRRLITATQKARRREKARRKARASRLEGAEQQGGVFLTHVVIHSDDDGDDEEDCYDEDENRGMRDIPDAGREVSGGNRAIARTEAVSDLMQSNEVANTSGKRDGGRKGLGDSEGGEGSVDGDIFDVDFSDDNEEERPRGVEGGGGGIAFVKQQSSVEEYENDFSDDDDRDGVCIALTRSCVVLVGMSWTCKNVLCVIAWL